MPPTTYHLRNESGIEVFTGTIVPAPGGGSQPGAAIVHGPFPVNFDDAGLTTGKALLALAENDIILDLWVEIVTPWDGTTPTMDFGAPFQASQPGIFHGFDSAGVALDSSGNNNASGVLGVPPTADLAAAALAYGSYAAPLRVLAADSLSVVVSQDGTQGGADPGAMQGQANVYVVVSTPVAPA